MSTRSAATQTSETRLIDGEFRFTDRDFQRIAAHLYQMAGIALPESKTTLVYSRLAKRVRALGLNTFEEYCQLIETSGNEDEAQTMMRALTTNVTRFYREPHHFDHMRDNVVAPKIAQVRAGGRLRLWSAACSTGQEPYSMALTLLEAFPDAVHKDVRILATDIDSNVVATAREGAYSEELLEAVPTAQKQKWFQKGEHGQWVANETLRSLISFRELNLLGNWPMKGPFDAIFCRNVVIYFDEPTQDRVWRRFADMLSPDAMLYIGHSERVGYEGMPFTNDGLTSYRKGR